MLDRILAYHCSPAMVGIKPSNIVTCHRDKYPNIEEDIIELNKALNKRDIYIETICECPKHALLIVYKKQLLIEQLRREDVASFLKEYGYDENEKLDYYLNRLRNNLKCDSFPHEIGAFLGYPLHDINGFIKNKGQDYLCVGAWKVYDDVESAQKKFASYKRCTNIILKKVLKGQRLSQIFCAA